MIQRTLHSLKKLPGHVRSRMGGRLISPRAILDDLKLEEGDVVLELGNPTGFFAPAAVDLVGTPGRMIVAGPNLDSFDRIKYLVEARKVEPVLLADVLLGKAFAQHSLDVVLLTNLLSSSLHPSHFCLSLNSYLKLKSRIVLVDWQVNTGVGPEHERKVSREDAIRMLTSCGWKFESSLRTPGYHYGLVFRNNPPVR